MGGRLVKNPYFRSRWRQNSPHDCMALHCTELFIFTLALSRYDLKMLKGCKTPKHQLLVLSRMSPNDVDIGHKIFSTVILYLLLIQEGLPELSFSGKRLCTILINRLED